MLLLRWTKRVLVWMVIMLLKLLKGIRAFMGSVTGHPRDTFHHNPPFPPQFAAISDLCQAHETPPISTATRIRLCTTLCSFCACSPSNQVNDINPPFLSLTFSPYAISWLHHTVHIHSLIISTLLHIIATCTHSITLHYIKPHPVPSRPVPSRPIPLCLACKIT